MDRGQATPSAAAAVCTHPSFTWTGGELNLPTKDDEKACWEHISGLCSVCVQPIWNANCRSCGVLRRGRGSCNHIVSIEPPSIATALTSLCIVLTSTTGLGQRPSKVDTKTGQMNRWFRTSLSGLPNASVSFIYFQRECTDVLRL